MSEVQMTKRKKTEWRALLVIVMFIIIILFATQLSSVFEDIDKEAFDGQWQEKVQCIDLMMDEINSYFQSYDEWTMTDYSRELTKIIAKLDTWPGVYSALYDSAGQLMTERTIIEDNSALNQIMTPQLWSQAAKLMSGEEAERVRGANGGMEWIRVYYRWMPMNDTGDIHRIRYRDRVLFVLAMQASFKAAHPTGEVVKWCIGLLAVAMLNSIVTGGVLMLRPLGKGGKHV
ncbi:hypothetical protein FACS1894184_13660 [Clostridia bacterium]|nr:hypothetical protein FACS1894184_13660 [Clostridia bacterium]